MWMRRQDSRSNRDSREATTGPKVGKCAAVWKETLNKWNRN
jgi:hypothetical protein